MYKPKIKGYSDTTLVIYWKEFRKSAVIDKRRYEIKLNNIISELRSIKAFLEPNKKYVKDVFHIDLDSYTKEWVYCVFSKSEPLYNTARKCTPLATSKVKRETLEKIIRYCNLLRQYAYTYKLIKSVEVRLNINFHEYLRYVRSYYNQVHRIMLEGDAYRYNHNIGTIVLNFWRKELKSSDEKATLRFIDFQATKKLKQQIIDAGKTPYNKTDAAIAKHNGNPYDGIPYIVYNDRQSYLQLCLYDSKVLGNLRLIFNDGGAMYDERFKYYSTIEKMAEKLVDFNELVHLSADVKLKAKIMIEKYPESYLNLIRNPTMLKRYAQYHYR